MGQRPPKQWLDATIRILRYAARGLRRPQSIMEGYLIRLPSSAWDVDERSSSARASLAKTKRQRPSVKKAKAKLMYYVLGEGYLDAFASPEDVEPLESFRLTSFQVEVDPIYSMLMFRVTTSPKRPLGQPTPMVQAAKSKSPSSGEENESDDDNSVSRKDGLNGAEAEGSSLLLFAGDRTLVEKWCNKLLNWNRYVFAGGAPNDSGSIADVKQKLITAFIDMTTRGMFTSSCDLIDCTATRPHETQEMPTTPTEVGISTNPASTASLPSVATAATTKPLPNDVIKPGTAPTEIKPLWMLLNRSASRRISAVSFHK